MIFTLLKFAIKNPIKTVVGLWFGFHGTTAAITTYPTYKAKQAKNWAIDNIPGADLVAEKADLSGMSSFWGQLATETFHNATLGTFEEGGTLNLDLSFDNIITVEESYGSQGEESVSLGEIWIQIQEFALDGEYETWGNEPPEYVKERLDKMKEEIKSLREELNLD